MAQVFKLSIETGNDAVQTQSGISELLHMTAARIYHGSDSGVIHDRNGNSVGSWEITTEDDEEPDERDH